MALRKRKESIQVKAYVGVGPDGRQVWLYETVKGTGRTAMNEAKAVEVRLKEQAKKGLEGLGKKSTLNELFDEWLPVVRHEASTSSREESYLNLHIRPYLGKRPLDRITRSLLNRHYLDLERGKHTGRPLAASTVKRIHGIIHAALQYAVEEHWLNENPAANAKLARVDAPDPDAPPVEEVLKMFAEARISDPEMLPFLRVGSATGLRPGSVCGLRWNVLDFRVHKDGEGQTIWGTLRHVRAIGQGKGAPYEKETKSRARHAISLDRGTVAWLRWHRVRMIARSKEFGGLPADAFVFSGDPTCSKPWRPDHASKRFRKLADRVGATFQLRELRHFNVSQLMDAGVDLGTISVRLTHSRNSTTANYYKAWSAAADGRASNVIGRILDGR
jgi:integrase